MRRKREVLLISLIRTTMVFSYSKVLPNPWEKTPSATIIIYQSLVQFLRSRHESSKYDISSYASKHSLRFLILPELVIIPKNSKGNLQERPHSYLYKQKRWKLHIKTNKQHPKSHPSKSSRDNQLSNEPNTSCVHIKLTFLLKCAIQLSHCAIEVNLKQAKCKQPHK